MKNYSILPLLVLIACFAFVSPVHANAPAGQGNANPPAGTGNPGTTLINPLSSNCTASQSCLEGLLTGILDIIIRVGTIVIVLMLVYIGYLFATSSVQPENKQAAKGALLWTIVGALILLGAQAIALGIQATVNALSVGQ